MDIKKNLHKIFFSISFSFLVGIFCIFAFSFLGFIFHKSINIYNPIFGMIISIAALYYSLLVQKTERKYFLPALLFYAGIIVLGILIGVYSYDNSIDGRAYHQAGIILLSEGYNPVYDNIEKFAHTLYNTPSAQLIWVENYPKFSEIICANILCLTHKIEISKMLAILSAFMVFGYAFYILNKDIFSRINTFLKVCLCTLFVLNPIFIAQFLTFCTDFYIYIFFIMIMFATIDLETDNENTIIPFTVIVFSGVCLFNVKLGGILYLFVTVLAYLIYLIIKHDRKKLINLLVTSIIITFFSLLSGINPYYTNIKQNRHIFYPLAGENKIDIMSENIPSNLQNKNYLKQFAISTFSELDNYGKYIPKKNNFKIPFSINKNEIIHISGSDVRISGFGIFWSGILLLCLLLSIFIRYNSKEEKRLAIYIFLVLVLLLITNPYCWWARYVPHFWALPIFVIIFYLTTPSKKITDTIISYLLIIFMILNSSILLYENIMTVHTYYKNTNYSIKRIKEKKTKIKIFQLENWGLIRKLEENGIETEFVDEDYFYEHQNNFQNMKLYIFDNMYWDLHTKYEPKAD